MTLSEALARNPYDPKKGNATAYCRYLRYNVDGWYELPKNEVMIRWQAHEAVQAWKETLMDALDKIRKGMET